VDGRFGGLESSAALQFLSIGVKGREQRLKPPTRPLRWPVDHPLRNQFKLWGKIPKGGCDDPQQTVDQSALGGYWHWVIHGCICWATGSVQHLIVIYAAPGEGLRLRGALGPLQMEGVDGTLAWALKPSEGGTNVTQSYVVGGYIRSGEPR